MATRRPKAPKAHLAEAARVAAQKAAAEEAARAAEEARLEEERLAAAAQAASSAAKVRRPVSEKIPVVSRNPTGASGSAPRGGAKNKDGKASLSATKSAEAATDSKAGQKNPVQDNTPVPARAFSGRLVVLAFVLVAIVVVVAPTAKTWWEQRQQLSDIKAEIAQEQQAQSDLTKQVNRWQDPAYVKQQARDRINMVMPGETGYWVFGAEKYTTVEKSTADTGNVTTDPAAPWTTKFMDAYKAAAK